MTTTALGDAYIAIFVSYSCAINIEKRLPLTDKLMACRFRFEIKSLEGHFGFGCSAFVVLGLAAKVLQKSSPTG